MLYSYLCYSELQEAVDGRLQLLRRVKRLVRVLLLYNNYTCMGVYLCIYIYIYIYIFIYTHN